jgi:septal ring factor EnvC (AmiA/AmiB activator)
MPIPFLAAGFFARPAVLASIAGVVLLGFGGLLAQDFFEDRGFRNEITRLQQELRNEVQANAGLRLAVSAHETSLEKLKATIAEMNARLDTMNARARQIESAANLRVARALRAGEEAAAALRAETTRVPPGNEAMNSWLRERLGS